MLNIRNDLVVFEVKAEVPTFYVYLEDTTCFLALEHTRFIMTQWI